MCDKKGRPPGRAYRWICPARWQRKWSWREQVQMGSFLRHLHTVLIEYLLSFSNYSFLILRRSWTHRIPCILAARHWSVLWRCRSRAQWSQCQKAHFQNEMPTRRGGHFWCDPNEFRGCRWREKRAPLALCAGWRRGDGHMYVGRSTNQ